MLNHVREIVQKELTPIKKNESKVSDRLTDIGILNSPNVVQGKTNSVGPEERYRVGTLRYTKAGLVTLFLWLLWGDFCFTLMEQIVPKIIPLRLEALKAPNWLMAFLATTIPSILTFFICPIVSFKSDRYRSRWGRRIPFMLFATPFITLFLILIGLHEPIGRYIYTVLAGRPTWLSPETVFLILLGVLMVGFRSFDLFVGSVYYYLFNDVVPKAFLGRFMSLFRIIGTAAGALFSMFIFKYARTNMREIFLGAAVLYFIAFMGMCLKVREGDYPPPPENIGNRKGILASMKTYFSECFTHQFYWYFFLSNAVWTFAGATNFFLIFLRLSLGLTLDQIGKIEGAAMVVVMIALYPAGFLVDKYHPLRVMIGAKVCAFLLAPLGLVYLFWDFSPNAVWWITVGTTCLTLPAGIIFGAATLPMYMRLLPEDRYGQFCSANSMVMSATNIIGGVTAGLFMDLMKNMYHGNPYYYRYIPVWTIAFEALSLVFLFGLYGQWKKLGGMNRYTPPSVESNTAM